MRIMKTDVRRWLWSLALLFAGLLAQSQAFADTSLDQGRLWRIEQQGRVSYLFGTMHSEHADVVTLPLIIRSHFESAKTLVLEMVLDQDAVLALSRAGMISDGPDLRELLGPALYRRTADAMEDYGVPEHALRSMKPWMVFSTLMMPKSRTGMFLDLQLYYEALAKGKTVKGIETAQEQIAVFDTMPIADQVVLLEDTLEQLPEMQAYFDRMREIYLSGDLAALERFSNEMMAGDDPELIARFNRRFITDRNRLMAERLEPVLKDGDAFIAIGALHLPGEQGVLHLLQQKGYEVSAEY